MKIKGSKETKKRISIETMLYRIAETNTSISMVVLMQFSIAVLNGCRTAVWKCRNISEKKQRNRAINY
jgi:hypothetical protein